MPVPLFLNEGGGAMEAEKLLEIARKLDAFGERERAVKAYALAVQSGLENAEALCYPYQKGCGGFIQL